MLSETRIENGRSASKTALWQGIKAEIPITIGVIPFGMIYGVLALAAGLPPLLAQAMSAIVFAGSAQFIGVQLMAAGTPLAILWLTTFVVNIRLISEMNSKQLTVGLNTIPLSKGQKEIVKKKLEAL